MASLFYLCVWAHARFACLSSYWAITTGKLLGPTTCLPHENGDMPLSALPKDTTSNLAGLFSTLSPCAKCQAGKRWIPFFKVVWYYSTWGMNPRSTDCEADALTTTPLQMLGKFATTNKSSSTTKKLWCMSDNSFLLQSCTVMVEN